jgi:hypothetical protein
MTGLTLNTDPTDETRQQNRPLVSVGITAAGLATLFGLALKFGWFAALNATPVTLATLAASQDAHHAAVVKYSEGEEKALARIVRLLELKCIQDAKTAYDRDACLRP